MAGEKMMQKNPLKKCVFLLLFLLVMGILGLILGFIDSNRNYERSLAHIQYLQANLGNLHGQLVQANEEYLTNEKKYTRIDFLEYQSAIFQKKFPDFSKIINITYNKSKVFGFQPNLILAVMQVESGFNPLALSVAGAYGLMQVRYAVWKDELNIDKNRIFDIEYNIELGLQILKQYYDLSGGNIKRALFLYNNGYKYQNTGYFAKVNNSIYNQDMDTAKLANISQ
jgi:soluble lytic murein transglycosylase-like protein